MPRKTKIEPEPEGAEEIETVEPQEETKEEEIEEDKPITKPKQVLTEKQLESLKRARQAAAEARIKRTSAKSKSFTKERNRS